MSNQKMPAIKRKQVSTPKKENFKVKDSKGKKHKVRSESFAEAEIEDLTLIKIAPMYYFSVESNKVVFIPFTIKYSAEQFAQQTAQQAVNFESVLNQAAEIRKQRQAAGDKN